ncbi:MAG: FMN-binding negative transcriptional regulator [Bacillota bacterium]
MYTPKSFEVNEKETMYDMIESNSFAILFSQKGDAVYNYYYNKKKVSLLIKAL